MSYRLSNQKKLLFRTEGSPPTEEPVPGEVYFGVEIETRPPDADEMLSRFCTKCLMDEIEEDYDGIQVDYDSSLAWCGLEIKTDPMTIGYMLAHEPLRNLLRALREHEFYCPDGYGMHVHVSQNAIKTAAHLSRIIKLVVNNKDLFVALGNRGDESPFCRIGSMHSWKKTLCKIGKLTSRSDALVALGERGAKANVLEFCAKYGTLEMRIFQGTVSHSRAMANVQLVNELVTNTASRSVSAASLMSIGSEKWDDFFAIFGSDTKEIIDQGMEVRENDWESDDYDCEEAESHPVHQNEIFTLRK